MRTFIYVNKQENIDNKQFEVVETKGKGHPDNICDTLAEKISGNYSKYCLNKYGVVLRHMIDKLSILGGGSKVQFGKGEMLNPIRILINGRFTDKYGEEKIDYMSIVSTTIKDYIKNLFPLLDVNKFLVIIDNTHHNEGPGVVYNSDNTTNNERKNFFEVTNEKDLSRHGNQFKCNDTSTTVSYYPMSKLEQTVLSIEQILNSKEYSYTHPWVGSDIKVMGIKKNSKVEITSCVPLISFFVKDLEDYKSKLTNIKNDILNIAKEQFPNSNIDIYLNTRDNYEKNDLYLTVIGSAVESGDEGAVGRGNRSRGVIPFSRNFSMEASCGKNPVYHTGKLFAAIGDQISKKIFCKFGIENVVFCTSRMGDSIDEPWNISVELNQEVTKKTLEEIDRLVQEEISNHSNITMKIINEQIKLNSY
ncbi:MAG: methionine adenosyltransferase [Clostridia bacterium]|nr:methionine adenosyltransferase [Tissierellia bacterium]MDD4387537.1 methionine adenosyltransferase [Clostridia bacterium]